MDAAGREDFHRYVPTSSRVAFGKQLRVLRLERGISQETLAEMAGLHRNYVGVLERAQQSATIDAICKLAAALKVRPAVLLETL